MLNLAEIANVTKSILVTTKKDFVRIPKLYRSLISTLDGEIEFEDENEVENTPSNIEEIETQKEEVLEEVVNG